MSSLRVDSLTQDSPATIKRAFLYAAPFFGVSLLMGPLAVLSGIYAKHYGFALTTIATVILVARLFDAITDPVIG